MRAAVLTAEHGFEVQDVADPTPGAGELVVRVAACGICSTDLKWHTKLPAGSILGHELCGEVVAVGTGVEGRWQEGQPVASMPLLACGRCRWCEAGEPGHCDSVRLIGLGGPTGGFAELVRVSADLTTRLDGDLGPFGALVEPLAVGLHAAAAGHVGDASRVLVIGAGTIGAASAMWARRLGAREVVVSDPVPSRRASADRFGATGVHDPADGPLPGGFDVVVECVGIPGMLERAVAAAGVHGRVVIAGACEQPDTLVPAAAARNEVDVAFAVFYRREEFATAARVLADGGIDPEAFVTSQVPLDVMDETFAQLLTGDPSDRKILVVPGD